MDEEWRAREHDDLVEPMFGGLRAHDEARRAADHARGARRLWLALALVAASLVVRAWSLL